MTRLTGGIVGALFALVGCGGRDDLFLTSTIVERLRPWREIHEQVDRAYMVRLGAAPDGSGGLELRSLDEEVDGRAVVARGPEFGAEALRRLRSLLTDPRSFADGVAPSRPLSEVACLVLRAGERASTLRVDLPGAILEVGSSGGPPPVRVLLSPEGRDALRKLLDGAESSLGR